MAAAPDAGLPDAQMLRTRMIRAVGSPNNNYRETIVETGNRGTSISRGFYRGANSRVILTRGSRHSMYGTYAGADWHQNPNGIVVADVPEPGLTTPVTTTTTVRRLSSQGGAYVLAVLDRHGYGSRDYIDPATYLVRRHDEINVTGTTTTTYAAYEHFGTQMLPALWRVDDGPYGETTTYRRTEFRTGSTTAANVMKPAGRRIVAVPAGRGTIDLHAHFEGGRIAIPVRIAGRTLFFLLDSGASTITIDPGVARRLGLSLGHADHEIAGKPFEMRDTVIPEMDVAGLTMRDVVASAVPLGTGRTPLDPAGLLGFDFLAQLVVRIDYEHRLVLVIDAPSYKPPRGRDVSALGVRLNSQVPMVSAKLGGAAAQRLIVDTGSVGALLLFDYFARRHDDVLRSVDTASTTSTGIGGEFKSRAYRVDGMHIGHFSLRDLVADVVVTRGAYPQNDDGLIGGDLLQFFTVDFDYEAGRIFLRTRPSLSKFVS